MNDKLSGKFFGEGNTQLFSKFLFAVLLLVALNGNSQLPAPQAIPPSTSRPIILRQTHDEDFATFKERAAAWRSLTNKPPLPEETRKYRVLAEDAYKEKRFEDAAKYYEEGLKVEPLWPQAQFNVAMIESELHCYSDAAFHMRCYVELVPDAQDTEDSRDKIIIWEEKAKNPEQQPLGSEADTLNYYRQQLRINKEDEWNAIEPKIRNVLVAKEAPSVSEKNKQIQKKELLRAQGQLQALLNNKQKTVAVSLGLLPEGNAK
jgi:tetratricopeptide (TPR) repeat protein